MARSRRSGRSKPVSEREAGEKTASGDEVDEMLEGAKTPDGEDPKVEAVPSGPQGMPGSAGNREAPPEASAPTESAGSDLRDLAPKKPPRKVGRNQGRLVPGGATAHERVLARGIDRGDLENVAPVERFIVTAGGRAMIEGRICEVKRGARITRLTHDLERLRLQGIEFELVDRG